MAVTTMNNPSSLRVKLDAGRDDSTGNTIVKSKTYSNLKYDANNQDVYDVAQALMGLQDTWSVKARLYNFSVMHVKKKGE